MIMMETHRNSHHLIPLLSPRPAPEVMALSNFSLVLASWTLTCSGFVVMTAPMQGHQDACESAFSGSGEGLPFRPGRDEIWQSGRPSRVPRRRRHLARITFGVASRAAGRPGGVEGLDGALEGGLSKDAGSGKQAGAQPSTSPAAGQGKSNRNNALMAQMVKAAGQRQHWKEAIVMFDEMQEEGVPPVKAAYAAALRACAKGAEWERGTQLLDNYLEEGYTLDEGVVQAAVKACCRAGRPSEAEAILVKSLERGVVPEVSLFTAVMNACYTVGDMDAILSLGEQLRAQSLTPDHAGYHLMVTSHIGKLDWVRATEALVEMGKAGLAPSAGSARKWRLATAAIEEIDIDVDEDSYNMLREEAGAALGDGGGGDGGVGGSRWIDGGERRSFFEERGQEEQ